MIWVDRQWFPRACYRGIFRTRTCVTALAVGHGAHARRSIRLVEVEDGGSCSDCATRRVKSLIPTALWLASCFVNWALSMHLAWYQSNEKP